MNFDFSGNPVFSGLNEEKYNTVISLPSPCYVIDEARIEENAVVLRDIADRCGAKILLAQKAFSNYAAYGLLSKYLDGTEASGLYEARLGYEEMPGKECHVFCAAYRSDDFNEILKYADHIVFNSPNQLKKFGALAKKSGKSIGLRVNPECSTQDCGIYDPCAPKSRLGTTRSMWDRLMTNELISMLDGIHFHTLCEQNSDALKVTLERTEELFGEFLRNLKWINFGGGHHITRRGYDIDTLCRCVKHVSDKYGVTVYIEPGEAVALNAGYLVTEVLDTFETGSTAVAIVDMSAACHTPDVLEMPYKPPLLGAAPDDTKNFSYRLGCPTCLAGDILGDYSFDNRLCVGDKLLLGDMAIYSTCKNNTFNGMKLPEIYMLKKNGEAQRIASFGYNDFKCRLGG